jgi:membrane fusion protein, multidrug efflux system
MAVMRLISCVVAAGPLVVLVLGLSACNKPAQPAPADAAKPGTVAASAAAAVAAAAAAAAASAPTLLLGAEDVRTLQPLNVATGPVISGTVQPERKADLRAEVAAVVQQVFKDNGEPVRAGELLVRLDDTAIRDSLGSADEAVRASTQAFEQTERQVLRLKTLQAQGMTSTQALEDAEVRRNNAQSDLVAAKARVVTARQQLRRTEVRAPFDGVVADRKVSAGDTAQVGKELLKVMDPRSMRFEGLVSADRLAELKPGQLVGFRVNGAGQGDFAGKVKRIDAAANATTRQVEVLVSFVDAATAPRVAGLFAEGRIETGGKQALVLPEGSIVRAGDLAYVWRLSSGNAAAATLQKVAVTLGERDPRSGQVPVLGGVAAGERVLRNPSAALREGQRFEFARPAATPAASSALSAAN